MCFTVNISKFLRTSILKNICERLLLDIGEMCLGSDQVSLIEFEFTCKYQTFQTLKGHYQTFINENDIYI